MPEQAHNPPFWNELSDQERAVWNTLEDDKRNTLAETAKYDMRLVKKALANEIDRRKQNVDQDEEIPPTSQLPSRASETDQERGCESEAAEKRPEMDEERKERIAHAARSWNEESKDQRAERLKRETAPQKTPKKSRAKTKETNAERRKRQASNLKALEEAKTTPAILHALASALWADGTPKSRECPQEQIPTEVELCDFRYDLPKEAQQEAINYLNRLETLGERPEGCNWSWFSIYLENASNNKRLCVMLCTWNGDELEAFLQHIPPPSIEKVHLFWKKCPNDQRPPHPLKPIVKAWQARPVPVEYQNNSNPIFPGLIIQDTKIRRTSNHRFWTPPHHVQQQGDVLLCLPGFRPGEEFSAPETPSLPLALYDLGIGRNAKANGPGAPLALRIFIEACLAVPPDARGTGPCLLRPVRLKEFLQLLYPNGTAKHWRAARHLAALLDALAALDSPEARIPWRDPDTGRMYARRVVTTRDVPYEGRPDDWISFLVDLPPGSDQGFIVDAPVLRRAGVQSVMRYRLALSLSAHWHEPGKTRRPIKRYGRVQHWYQSKNPKHYKEVHDRELISMAFPTDPEQTRKRLYNAKKALDDLVTEGFAAVFDKRNNRRRIIPGPSWSGWPSNAE